MEERKVTYKDILSNPEYRKLIFSSVIDRFGDSVDAIAFTWIVYKITGSAAWSAIVFGLNMLPNVLVQPFAGAIVERMNKKLVIIVTHLMRAAVIIVFALMYRFGTVNAYVLVAITLLITTIESFNLPANSAFIAKTISKEDMTSGISLNTMLTGAAALAGTGLGGVIIAAWGVIPAMFVDVLTFAIAASLIASMRSESKSDSESKQPETAVRKEETFFSLFKDGIRYVINTPVVRNFCLLCVALNFMLVPINALQAPIASEIFKSGAELLSFAGAMSSIGGILGSAVLPAVSRKFSPLKITCMGIVALGLGILGISFGGIFAGNRLATYLSAGFCLFIMMMAASLIGGVLGIQFKKSVDGEYMARASAVFGATSTAAMPIGSFMVSVLLTVIPTSRILLFGAVFAGIILLATGLLKPSLEKKEDLYETA